MSSSSRRFTLLTPLVGAIVLALLTGAFLALVLLAPDRANAGLSGHGARIGGPTSIPTTPPFTPTPTIAPTTEPPTTAPTPSPTVEPTQSVAPVIPATSAPVFPTTAPASVTASAPPPSAEPSSVRVAKDPAIPTGAAPGAVTSPQSFAVPAGDGVSSRRDIRHGWLVLAGGLLFAASGLTLLRWRLRTGHRRTRDGTGDTLNQSGTAVRP